MAERITDYTTLLKLVHFDKTQHPIKELTELFIEAMTNWPKNDQMEINEFITDIKNYFGTPLAIENISRKEFNGYNLWQIESGTSIIDLIALSKKHLNESNFDTIICNILNYYEQQYTSKVAELV